MNKAECDKSIKHSPMLATKRTASSPHEAAGPGLRTGGQLVLEQGAEEWGLSPPLNAQGGSESAVVPRETPTSESPFQDVPVVANS